MRFLIIAFLLLCFSNVTAQDPVETAYSRGSDLIDSTMSSVNIRAERFNEEIGKINAIKALDVPKFHKDTIVKNRQKIKDFLEYLEVYRSLSTTMMRNTEDSVKELRAMLPKSLREEFLQDFLDAFESDQKAFNAYTLALTKVFTNVVKVLDFLDTARIELRNNKVVFFDKEESEAYSKLLEAVELSQKKSATAGATSQRTSIDAHRKIQKAYGLMHK